MGRGQQPGRRRNWRRRVRRSARPVLPGPGGPPGWRPPGRPTRVPPALRPPPRPGRPRLPVRPAQPRPARRRPVRRLPAGRPPRPPAGPPPRRRAGRLRWPPGARPPPRRPSGPATGCTGRAGSAARRRWPARRRSPPAADRAAPAGRPAGPARWPVTPAPVAGRRPRRAWPRPPWPGRRSRRPVTALAAESRFALCVRVLSRFAMTFELRPGHLAEQFLSLQQFGRAARAHEGADRPEDRSLPERRSGERRGLGLGVDDGLTGGVRVGLRLLRRRTAPRPRPTARPGDRRPPCWPARP